MLEPDDIRCFATAVQVSAWIHSTGHENTATIVCCCYCCYGYCISGGSIKEDSRDSSPKIDISPLYDSSLCECRVWWHFLICITTWEFHRQEEFHLMVVFNVKKQLGEKKHNMSLHCLCGVIQVCVRLQIVVRCSLLARSMSM